MARIDVVMPVKDGGDLLPSAILSILYQTERDIRLIIVNDRSGADTLAIMHRFAQADSRVAVVNAQGAGIVDALNTGLDHATAPYVARMDGDDIALPTRLAMQLAVMDARPEVSLCGTAVIRFGSENRYVRPPTSAEQCRHALRLFNCFYHPTVMIRRQVLQENNIRYSHSYEYAEDYKLFCDLAKAGEVINIEEPLLLYRTHSDQVTKTKSGAQNRAALDVIAHQAQIDSQGLQSDIRTIAAMLHAATQLGRPHARRSLNALKNAISATRASQHRPS